jgi:hypothetical protein
MKTFVISIWYEDEKELSKETGNVLTWWVVIDVHPIAREWWVK